MSDAELLKEMKKLAIRDGVATIRGALISLGMGSRTAERIADGTYSRRPGGLLRAAMLTVLKDRKVS